MIDERRQFRVLYRSFLFRVVDIELLTASGEVHNLLAQFAALLAAYSSVLALFTVTHFAQSTASEAKLIADALGARGVSDFDNHHGGRIVCGAGLERDAAGQARQLVLDPLPLQTRTIFRAKGAAIATALAMSILAVNIFTGISFPFLIVPSGAGALGSIRCLVSYWATMSAAGVFIFFFRSLPCRTWRRS